MGAAMTLSTPQDQVEALIQQVAEESGLEVIDQLKDLKTPAASVATTSKTQDQEREDDLTRRYVCGHMFVDICHNINICFLPSAT